MDGIDISSQLICNREDNNREDCNRQEGMYPGIKILIKRYVIVLCDIRVIIR